MHKSKMSLKGPKFCFAQNYFQISNYNIKVNDYLTNSLIQINVMNTKI